MHRRPDDPIVNTTELLLSYESAFMNYALNVAKREPGQALPGQKPTPSPLTLKAVMLEFEIRSKLRYPGVI